MAGPLEAVGQRVTQRRVEADDGLWLRLAATANDGMARLAAGLAAMGIAPDHQPDANMAFFHVDPAVIDAWQDAGLDFYRMGKGRVRLVTSFRSTPADVDEALRRMVGEGGEPPASR